MIDPGGLAETAFAYSKGKALYLSAETPLSINPMKAKFQAHQIFYILTESINQMISRSTDDAIKQMTPKMRVILHQEFNWCWENNRRRLDALRDRIALSKDDSVTRDGLLSRMDVLLSDPVFREIICGNDSIDIGTLIDRQESLILDCSQFSRDQMIFLGSIVINLIKSYFRYSRPKEYKPLLVFIDEAFNFLSQDIFITIREGRKYRVSFLMACQDFPRMAEDFIRMVLSNAGVLLSFKVGNREATMLQKEFRTLAVDQIQFPPKFHACFRTRDDEGIVKTRKAMPVRPVVIKKETRPEASLDEIKWFKLHPIA